MRTYRCKVKDPHAFRTGQLPDRRWIMGIDYVDGAIEWCDDIDIHPDNPRPFPYLSRSPVGGPVGSMPEGFELPRGGKRAMKNRRIYHPVKNWPTRVRLWTAPWGTAALGILVLVVVFVLWIADLK